VTQKKNLRHGLSDSQTHKSWAGMKERCNNASRHAYHNYGGRGISYDARWESFDAFLADMGQCPKDFSLDRFPDTNGNYEKSNCRWASDKEQARNTRVNVLIEFDGQSKLLVEWCEDLDLDYKRTHARIRYEGWTIARALGTPTGTGFKGARGQHR
jgi:hypothetical protein